MPIANDDWKLPIIEYNALVQQDDKLCQHLD